MELRTLLAVLRRGWAFIALSAFLTVIVAGLYLATATPSYGSTAEYLVSPRPSSDANSTYQAGLYVTGRMPSYAALATSASVAGRVVGELGLPDNPESLASQVTATVPTDTTIVQIKATADSAGRAQQLAGAFGEQFAVAVRQLDGDGPNTVVQVTVVTPAELPHAPTSPRRKLILAAALLLGLGIGVLAAVLRSRFGNRSGATFPGAPWLSARGAGSRRVRGTVARPAANRPGMNRPEGEPVTAPTAPEPSVGTTTSATQQPGPSRPTGRRRS